jgi:AcrR family transcriptional regulator
MPFFHLPAALSAAELRQGVRSTRGKKHRIQRVVHRIAVELSEPGLTRELLRFATSRPHAPSEQCARIPIAIGPGFAVASRTPPQHLNRSHVFAVTPDWNAYSGRARLLGAAWDALVDTDLLNLQIRTIAATAGLSQSAFYKHFRNMTDLLPDLAGAGLATLLVNLSGHETFEDFSGSWLRFASARPRHYALMFSPELAEHPAVTLRLSALVKGIAIRAELELGFIPPKPQLQNILGMIHGAAALVTAGFTRQSNQSVVEPISAYLAHLKTNA